MCEFTLLHTISTLNVYLWNWSFFYFIDIWLKSVFLSPDFGSVRPGQPGRSLPVRSVSLDMNVSPQQPSLQYPMRATSPYTLMQQQQGMVGSHSMMANQASMVSTGGCDSHAFVVPVSQCYCLNVCTAPFVAWCAQIKTRTIVQVPG